MIACHYGGNSGGVIGNIINSCTATNSCWLLGQGRGKAGHVTNSCNGSESCQSAGRKRGSIGSISQSCNAPNACDGAGVGSSNAIISNLMNCCNAQVGNECQAATQATLPNTCKATTKKPTRKPTPPPAASKVRKCDLCCHDITTKSAVHIIVNMVAHYTQSYFLFQFDV